MKKITKYFSFIRSKLKFLDYLIVLAILLFIFVIYKFLTPEEKWIDIIVFDQSLPLFQANSLHAGDYENDSSGKKISEIVSLYTTDNLQSLSYATYYKDIYLQLKILAKVDSRSGEFQYKNKIIKIGSSVDFRFNSTQINAKVTAIQNIARHYLPVIKIITIQIYNQWPWFADNLEIGQGETGENGKKITEIIEREVKPHPVQVTTAAGDILLKPDPEKVDIILKTKVVAHQIGNDLIFREDKKIAIGELISFKADRTMIKGATIIDIQ